MKTAALKRRFAFASELRAFADALRAPGADPVAIASRMRARAADVMANDDPVERGAFRAELVFAERGDRPARPVVAERRAGRRLAGTIRARAA